MASSLLLLNEKQITQKINRIAYQMVEDCFDEEEIILAGIADRGYLFALRLQKNLIAIARFSVTLIKVTLDKDSSTLFATTDLPLSICNNKTVIVVDDVLNTGKTLTYGMAIFINMPLKKLRTAVLVDRSHKLFPTGSDFTGLEISTVTHEHVSVMIGATGQPDAVYLQ